MADLGVHGVGEVDRGRAGGQADDAALRREDVDLFRADLEPQRVEELPRVGRLGLPVGDVREPGHVGVDATCASGFAAVHALLVLPVRRDAVLGRWCISFVRIWISTVRPPGPITVVCSDW